MSVRRGGEAKSVPRDFLAFLARKNLYLLHALYQCFGGEGIHQPHGLNKCAEFAARDWTMDVMNVKSPQPGVGQDILPEDKAYMRN